MESANDPKKFSILGNYDNKIFWPVAILYGCIIAYAIIDPSGAGATFSSIQRFIIAHFSWLILLTGASAIFFSVWMACSSRFATVKLGAADEKPEFSFFAWVAMLFCAALGTGFVIFGSRSITCSPPPQSWMPGALGPFGASPRPSGSP